MVHLNQILKNKTTYYCNYLFQGHIKLFFQTEYNIS